MKKLMFPLFVFVLLVSACGAVNEPIGSQSGPTATAQAPASSSPMPEPTMAMTNFPLKGLRFPAYSLGALNTAYDLVVTNDGRFYQPYMPEKPNRRGNSVAFELVEGRYIFDGVECTMYLDVSRNGKGSSNPVVANQGNNVAVEVRLPAGASYATAYALTECNDNQSTGFQLQYVGPLAAK